MALGSYRPSLVLVFRSLVLLSLLSTSASQYDQFRRRMGTLGKNYNLKKGVPYIQCEAWNSKTPEVNVTTIDCPWSTTGSEFIYRNLGCMKVYKFKNFNKFAGNDTLFDTNVPPEEFELISSGCWQAGDVQMTQCQDENDCIAVIHEDKKATMGKETIGTAFCCCTTHNCNVEVTFRFVRGNSTPDFDALIHGPADPFATTTAASLLALPSAGAVASSHLWVWPTVLIGLALIVLVLAGLVWLHRSRFVRRWLFGDTKVYEQKPNNEDESAVALVTMENGKKRNNLKEGLVIGETILADGKMGKVQMGTYTDPDTGKERIVAVKTVKDQKSFLLEEAVYRVCANSHSSMVQFFGTNYEPEINYYYVVMEHVETGSLEEYLKTTQFTPMEALHMITSLMDGLAFLHGPANLPGGGYKSAVVHRDIKSRNILVRADRTAVIIDFGLAMICEGNRPYGRTYQVGTHRYMSPELLASIANCNLEGLKMVDVYAAALIMWEILNRTLIDEEDEILPAQLPYTVEIDEEIETQRLNFEKKPGWNPREEYRQKPIIYYLKDIVHRDNRRPVLRERLKQNPITKEILRSLTDMWDFEVEGRISAACAHARLTKLTKDAIAGTIPAPGQYGYS
ncbi:daf-4 [Pristionchus pacificus]|uniref:receptor protein serine/threonine kinase n=1 Tax=Pristionchus pacificus TaxID=54126 RepID=A0A2A6B9Z5_PRIPA|nr:daf-4 [Pristionchus pacificus]|eukprot:PDM62699.1 daf-4 [Pristionchus pacificus]